MFKQYCTDGLYWFDEKTVTSGGVYPPEVIPVSFYPRRPDLGITVENYESEVIFGEEYAIFNPGSNNYRMDPDNPGDFQVRLTVREVYIRPDGTRVTDRVPYTDADGVPQFEDLETVQYLVTFRYLPTTNGSPGISGPLQIVVFAGDTVTQSLGTWYRRGGYFGLIRQTALFQNFDNAGKKLFDGIGDHAPNSEIRIPGDTDTRFAFPLPGIYDVSQAGVTDSYDIQQTVRYKIQDPEAPYNGPTLPIIPPGNGGIPKGDDPIPLIHIPQYVIDTNCIDPCQPIGLPHLLPLVEVKE